MCGIAGLVDFKLSTPAGDGEQAVLRMAARIAQRGPDDLGLWSETTAGVFFAHRRLSIVDLSAAGHQPMASASGRYMVVFNGEIYNHRSLRRELESLGSAAWRGHSDTEVMLTAFDTWGIEATLPKLVGMFAIAVWDRAERALTLIRDRAGEKPLYWGMVSGRLVFASELKAFEGLETNALAINQAAVPLMLRYSYIPAPHSIYEGVEKLMPGTWMRFTQAGQPTTRGVYWSAAHSVEAGRRNPLTLPAAQCVDELERLLTDAVKLQLEADVPVGAFLSGGIDSSTVVALAQRSASSKVRTFSIGFSEEGYDESAYARRVAEHLGTEHTELHVTSKDALDCVPLMAGVYDEPFADSSQIPTYLVAKLARQAVTVSLSGDGGDELFAGYPRYGRAQSLNRLLSVVPAKPRRVLAAMIEGVSPHAWSRVAGALGLGRESAAHRTHGDRLHRIAQMLRSDPHLVYQYLASSMPEVDRLMPHAHAAKTLHDDPASWPPTCSGSNLFMWLDLMTYLPDDLLAKVDRAAMAVSLESRVPILDHRIIEFSHRVPMDMKVRDGMRKWLLRQVLYRHVPRQLIDRPKMGFSLPVAAWLRGPLRDWAEGLLFTPHFHEAGIDAAALRRIWAEHLSGARDWHQAIWNILMLRGWQERRSATPVSPPARAA